MDNTTNQLQNQPEMTPDEAKASLGIANFLQEQLVAQDALQMQENAPQTGDNGEDGEMGDKENPAEMEAKFKEFKKEVQASIKEEIVGIKDMIKELLDEEDEEEGEDKEEGEDEDKEEVKEDENEQD